MKIDGIRLPNRADKDQSSAASGAVSFDLDSYKQRFPEPDLSAEAYDELLLTLFSIMKSFVDLGFDVKICEQIVEGFNEIATDSALGVPSSFSPTLEMPADGGKDSDE